MYNLSPELQLIIWSISVNPESVIAKDIDLKKDINWSLLIDTGIQHGIFPLLYNRLKNLKKNQIPEIELEKMKKLYLHNAGRN